MESRCAGALRYLAPFAAVSMGEALRLRGEAALVVVDDVGALDQAAIRTATRQAPRPPLPAPDSWVATATCARHGSSRRVHPRPASSARSFIGVPLDSSAALQAALLDRASGPVTVSPLPPPALIGCHRGSSGHASLQSAERQALRCAACLAGGGFGEWLANDVGRGGHRGRRPCDAMCGRGAVKRGRGGALRHQARVPRQAAQARASCACLHSLRTRIVHSTRQHIAACARGRLAGGGRLQFVMSRTG